MSTRRTFLRGLAATVTATAAAPPHVFVRRAAGAAADEARDGLAPAAQVRQAVDARRPLRGGAIPADLPKRLGATHYAGLYHRTDEPFLIEGCKALRGLGMGVVKLWLDRRLPGYAPNSDWSALTDESTLADVARHPYFKAAFAMPFSTFVLEVQHAGRGYRGGWRSRRADFSEDRRQLRDLAAHLLATYRDRDVRFIIQHWEGDWMLRDRPGDDWTDPARRPPAAVIEERCDAFVRWLAARQEGVEAARKEAGATRCSVEHAAEVNRVLDLLKGVPTLTSHVLPKVGLDAVSWSCYDGMGSVVDLHHGVGLIRRHAKPSTGRQACRVFVGEVGMPENERRPQDVLDFWDGAMATFWALDVPEVVHWQLYCNEAARGKERSKRPFKADEVRGFWLVRPDGSLSISGAYLKSLLDHAGGRLPTGTRPAG